MAPSSASKYDTPTGKALDLGLRVSYSRMESPTWTMPHRLLLPHHHIAIYQSQPPSNVHHPRIPNVDRLACIPTKGCKCRSSLRTLIGGNDSDRLGMSKHRKGRGMCTRDAKVIQLEMAFGTSHIPPRGFARPDKARRGIRLRNCGRSGRRGLVLGGCCIVREFEMQVS